MRVPMRRQGDRPRAQRPNLHVQRHRRLLSAAPRYSCFLASRENNTSRTRPRMCRFSHFGLCPERAIQQPIAEVTPHHSGARNCECGIGRPVAKAPTDLPHNASIVALPACDCASERLFQVWHSRQRRRPHQAAVVVGFFGDRFPRRPPTVKFVATPAKDRAGIRIVVGKFG